MQTAKLAIVLLFIIPVSALAQTANPANVEKSSQGQTQKLIEQVRQKLGGEEKLKTISSLSLSGKYRNLVRAGESTGDLKIDLLMPDKFMRTEKSNPQQLTMVTITQSLNGNQAWVDRNVSRASDDDGAINPNPDPIVAGTSVSTGTLGMRGTTTGTTTVRTTASSGGPQTERTVLGMRIPTSSDGRDRDHSLERMDNERRASAENKTAGNRPPPVASPDLKAELEKRLRKEFAALTLAWLAQTPESFPVNYSHAETLNTDNGPVEAIEITGPEDFAARLFIDRKTMLPAMISYRDFVKPGAGYIISANTENNTGVLLEIAVQFLFSDYRTVNGTLLPHQIVKAVNGAMVSEWKIDKYKLNPDLKPKKFEKK